MSTKKNLRKSLKRKGGNNKTKKCMDTRCKLWLEEAAINNKKYKKKFEMKYNEILEKIKKNCQIKDNKKTGNEKKENEQMCKELNHQLELFKSMIDGYTDKKKIKKGQKLELELCKTRNCNEGCKGTIFEDGPADTLPKPLENKYKKVPSLLEMFKKMRKEMFGNNTTILSDDFVKGIKKKDIEKEKKDGAISGCYRN